nr:MAG: hypothetical protein 3 [Leviviridae sp.]UJQ85953.1 MAG: putative replicase protein [Leviviridae sp.]
MEFQSDALLKLLQVDLHLVEALPLTSDLSITDARKSALLNSIFKKLEPEDASHLEAVAVATFKQCNDNCLSVKIEVEGYVGLAIAKAKAGIDALYYSGDSQSAAFTLHDMCSMGDCGPGSSLGTKRTDFLGKMFESEFTMTDVGLYRFYMSQMSPRWKQANTWRAEVCGDFELRSCSKLSSVPKNETTNRTICTEPSLNMFFQLGAGACIERLLSKGHNIDLTTQTSTNKRMAREGSINGKFSTIDLRSASDTISTTLVKHLLPRHLFALLDLIRSKRVKHDAEEFELHMFSSMGNGFTFPLQTLIFAELVRGAYDILGISPITSGPDRNYSVFGDDIICLKEAYNFVCQVLSACGFTVNDDKSFSVGAFRESCGGDYFKGFDIRAVYLRKVNATQHIYSAFNRLTRWSAKYSIDLSGVLLYLKGLVEFRPVPLDEQDSAGFKVPSQFLRARKTDRNGAQYYTSLVGEPRSVKIGSGYGSNSNGAIICAIGGYIRDNQMTIRVLDPVWKVKRRKTPCWDRVPSAELTTRDFYDALFGVF